MDNKEAVKKARVAAVFAIEVILDKGDIRCTFARGRPPNFADLLFLRFHFMQCLDMGEAVRVLRDVEVICEMLTFAAPVAWKLKPQLLAESVTGPKSAMVFAQVPVPKEHLKLIKRIANEAKETA